MYNVVSILFDFCYFNSNSLYLSYQFCLFNRCYLFHIHFARTMLFHFDLVMFVISFSSSCGLYLINFAGYYFKVILHTTAIYCFLFVHIYLFICSVYIYHLFTLSINCSVLAFNYPCFCVNLRIYHLCFSHLFIIWFSLSFIFIVLHIYSSIL